MPFKPFHKGSTTVPKGSKFKALAPDPSIPVTRAGTDPVLALKRMKAVTKMAKPSGSGPRGSAGYFNND